MKNTTLKQLAVGVGLALGLVAGIPSEALADTYILPGNICQGRLGTSRPLGMSIQANLGSELAYCALPRHLYDGTLGTSFARVYVPPEETVSCNLYACDSLGNTCDFDPASVTNSSTTAGIDVSMSLDGASVTTYAYGAYFLYCNLPVLGRVWSIRYSEIAS